MKRTITGLVFYALLLTGCDFAVHFPQYDFSTLKTDYFSTLVKKTHFVFYHPDLEPYHDEIYFDKPVATDDSRKYFATKTSHDVLRLFQVNGGHCKSRRNKTHRRFMRCEVSRYWRMTRKIGLRLETSDKTKGLPKPGARLVFRFLVSKSNRVKLRDVSSYNITILQHVENYKVEKKLFRILSKKKSKKLWEQWKINYKAQQAAKKASKDPK